MSLFTRRIASAFIVTALLGSIAAERPVFAQAPTVGPAGGVATTTAPSNSQGTPAGGTGTLGTTQVGPSGVGSAAPYAAAPAGTATTHRRARRHRRARHHRSAASQEVGTQSQLGTNGSVPPSER